MAHIVCVTTGLRGVLHASLEIVSRLERAGHRLTYACPLDVEGVVTGHGFSYRQLEPVNFDPAPRAANGAGGRLRRKWSELRTARARQASGVAKLGMAAFREFLEDADPDLVLLDMELHEHILTTLATGRPLALLNQFFSVWKQRGLPPIQRTTIPGRGLRGSALGMEMDWLRLRLAHWVRIQKTRVRYVGTDRRAVLRRLQRDLGLSSLQIQQFDWEDLFTYRGIPTLCLTAREMEFPHTPRPEHHFVGPMVHTGRRAASDLFALRRRIESIANRCKQDGRVLVYCSSSTMDSSTMASSTMASSTMASSTMDEGVDFLNKVIEAFRRRDSRTLILSRGKSPASAATQAPANVDDSVPPNVHLFDWVPQLEALKHADVSIQHGGIHGIHECIHHGVPMLVYSGKRFDQNGDAARVAYHRLGIAADRASDDSEAIARRLDELLADHTIRANIDRMRGIFESYRDDRVLEQAVDDILDSASQSRSSRQRQAP